MKLLIHSPKSLGSAVKRQRKLKKLSQTEAGKPFNLDQPTLSDIEKGIPGTRLETIFRALAALDLEMIIQSKIPSSKNKDEW